MRRSLRSLLWRVSIEQEVEEEIALHIEMRTRRLVERGMDPAAAREAVLARLGDLNRLKRTCVDLGRKREREMRLTQWLEEFGDDVRFAVRQLKTAPGFTLVATLTLALGIGANSAIFALADATLMRPLPFTDPDRLVWVWETRDGQQGRVFLNPLDLDDFIERNRTLESLAGFVSSGMPFGNPDGSAERVPALAVTTRFFDVFGVVPIAGRTFQRADEGPRPSAIVLGEAFWRRRFGGDVAVVGRELRLDGRPFTVIGIVPASFRFDVGTRDTALWTLLNTPVNSGASGRYAHYVRAVGRMKPGATLEATQADLAGIAAALGREMPATNQEHAAMVEPLRDGLVGRDLRLTSILLLGVVGFVLLLCCANVANLLLARTTGRARELAVRSALGAGRRRIMRQVLTESLVLAGLGGAAGAAIGAALLRVAPALMPDGLLPRTLTLAFDGRVLSFCAVAAGVVAVLFGLAPAWQASGLTLSQVLAFDSRTGTGRAAKFRSLLGVGQVAAAVLLLCGAGLLLRTLLAVSTVDGGFRATNVLTMMIGVSPTAAFTGKPDAWYRFYDSIEREVQAVPGVQRAGLGGTLPLDGGWYTQAFDIVGDPPKPQANRDNASYHMITPTYFETLDVPIVVGRGIGPQDIAGAPEVCVVNEAFVRRFVGNRNPIGMRVNVQAMVQPARSVVREIVGVVSQIKERPDEPEPVPQVYVPLAQNTWWQVSLVVRPVAGDAAALSPAVLAAIARVDRTRPAMAVRTLDDIGWEAVSRPRFRALLVATFALLALVLAAIGVFGMLAYSVQQRWREFGVRIALGATPRDLLGMVARSGGRVIAIGVGIGLVAAAVLGRTIASVLFGVQPLDPVTYVAVAALLGVTAVVATAVPAIRAARVDPVVAFRSE
jgi:putative ABC transport system permease protein